MKTTNRADLKTPVITDLATFGIFTVHKEGDDYVIGMKDGGVAFVIGLYSHALDLENAASHLRRSKTADMLEKVAR